MQYLDNILFFILLVIGFGLFAKGLKEIYRNIMLGKAIHRSDRRPERWKMMGSVALGQSKMGARPIAGFLHVLVYVGFMIVNIEMIEIIIDGIFGTHRVLASVLPEWMYNALTATLEIMALLVMVAVVIFFIRRNIAHVKRLNMKELLGWPKDDANVILIIEFVLMVAFFTMNASDALLQAKGVYAAHGHFPISQILFMPMLGWFNFDATVLTFLERGAWWFHIIGVLVFANYLYYSKHLHILLAFPNTWYAKLQPKGQFENLDAVTKEIKLMMDPNADPYAAPPEADPNAVPERFGAKDVFDLNRVQLLNAYTCTECGRCTSVCPANITGKKLSPRKIMMDTRDRLEEVGRNINKNGKFVEDGKSLIDTHIQREELRACTSCNACVEACPVLINPLSIIISLRQYMVMEESSAPQEWNLMFQNIENNAAPWQYNQADRLNWANE